MPHGPWRGPSMLPQALIDQIDERRADIQSIYEYIGMKDMSISIAWLRSNLPYYCIPEFIGHSKKAEVKDLYHPLVENCISNDLNLNNKSLLLTGSNMSGKSTFIKAFSLNLIASQTLNTSFSRGAVIGRLTM